MADVAEVVAALRDGNPVILPTDTVYGLCAWPHTEEPVRRMYALKGRETSQPTALVAGDVEVLFDCVPELRERAAAIVRALLPGPYTLVLPNPAQRFPWLAGPTAEKLGVRVPHLTGGAKTVLEHVGAVAATSANLPGGRDPRRLDEVPDELRAGVAAALDGGELPGTASTVVDFTGPEPRILREGAGDVGRALAAAGRPSQ